MDAFCQAVESYWSNRSTPQSRALAAWSVQLILQHMRAACSGDVSVARPIMCQAALMAGQAIDITRTTACHAVSYGLTHLFAIPHGHACALTLASFLKYNSDVRESDVADPRGVVFVRSKVSELLDLLDAEDVAQGALRITQLMEDIGLETRLSQLGVGRADVERLVKNGFDPSRAANNPRTLCADRLRKMLFEVI